ncbi:epididymal-specific lipocalin-6 [Pteropus alecto]|uniref:epididymal-specific lipocalin-6 n=1 Tax=Pteropus alecto TaxID=9402 RepID=UPI000D535330|nr:epididymal-specific lipocalin-6 [Pteropus alecto]
MRAVLLTVLLAVALGPGAQAVKLGRLDPQKLLGPWYVLAVASSEKGFAVEKATKNVEGVVVTLTPEDKLRVLSSRHRLERCDLSVVELLRQNSGWVFENPSLGVLEYRVLGTDFQAYAVVFTQLELGDEAFSTVELYSRTERASQEAMERFTKWSQGLGFLSQQRAQLQTDRECRQGPLVTPRAVLGPRGPLLTPGSVGDPSGLRESGRTGVTCAQKAFQVSCRGGAALGSLGSVSAVAAGDSARRPVGRGQALPSTAGAGAEPAAPRPLAAAPNKGTPEPAHASVCVASGRRPPSHGSS